MASESKPIKVLFPATEEEKQEAAKLLQEGKAATGLGVHQGPADDGHDIPGLNADVYYGDAETPLPDWEDLPRDDADEEEPTEEERAGVKALLGFDPAELDEGEPTAGEKSLDGYPAKDSYLANCPRDEQGHCLPKDEADRTGGKEKDTDARREEVYSHFERLAKEGFEEAGTADRKLAYDDKQAYPKELRRVLGAMTGEALGLVKQNVRKIAWYPNLDSLSTAYQKRTGRELGLGQAVSGSFDAVTGTLHLDGHIPHKDSAWIHGGGTVWSVHGTYAHELSHAMDLWGRLSLTPEWRTAWIHEIGRHGGDVTLSRYAQSSATEGFAEFGRLLYGTDNVDKKELERRFPKCLAFFRKHQLWQ